MVLPLLTRLDHVGIACRDLRRAIDMYRETFGLGVLSLEENEEQGVREAMLAVGPAGADAGPVQGRADRDAAQFAGRLAGEGSEQAAYRCPRRADYDRLTWFAHACNDT